MSVCLSVCLFVTLKNSTNNERWKTSDISLESPFRVGVLEYYKKIQNPFQKILWRQIQKFQYLRGDKLTVDKQKTCAICFESEFYAEFEFVVSFAWKCRIKYFYFNGTLKLLFRQTTLKIRNSNQNLMLSPMLSLKTIRNV